MQEHFDSRSEKRAVKKPKTDGETPTVLSTEKEGDENASSLHPLASDELIKLDESEEKTDAKPTEHDLEIEKRLGSLREAMHIKAVENIENSDLKSIFLEGELPHDPQILVSATETETKMERMSQYAKDVADDEAVILSGKMTISLISLTNHEDETNGVVEDHSTTNNVA